MRPNLLVPSQPGLAETRQRVGFKELSAAERRKLLVLNPCTWCGSIAPKFRSMLAPKKLSLLGSTWVVVKIMVPFWVPIIIRHPIFRVPKKGP